MFKVCCERSYVKCFYTNTQIIIATTIIIQVGGHDYVYGLIRCDSFTGVYLSPN